MLEKLKAFIRDNKYYLIFLSVMIVYHCLLKINFGDEVKYFGKVLSQSSYAEFIVKRWNTWSSRILIELVLITVAHISYILWRVLDILVWTLALFSLSKLLDIDKRSKEMGMLTLLILLYPFFHMRSAGWVATSLNYIWPLAFGLYALTIIRKIYHDQKPSLKEYFLLLPTFLFSINQEQVCAIYLVILIALLFDKFLHSRIAYELVALIGIDIIQLILILNCPGNALRLQKEIKRWMPDFIYKNTFNKLDMGIVHISNTLTNEINLLFIFCSLYLVYLMYMKNKGRLLKLLAYVPALYFCAPSILAKFHPLGAKITKPLLEFYYQKGMTGGNFGRSLFAVVALAVFIGLLVYMADTKKEKFFTGTVLGIGFVSAWVLGFSPTCFASSSRTMIFFYFSVIYVFMRTIQRHAFVPEHFLNFFQFLGLVNIINTCMRIR